MAGAGDDEAAAVHEKDNLVCCLAVTEPHDGAGLVGGKHLDIMDSELLVLCVAEQALLCLDEAVVALSCGRLDELQIAGTQHFKRGANKHTSERNPYVHPPDDGNRNYTQTVCGQRRRD